MELQVIKLRVLMGQLSNFAKTCLKLAMGGCFLTLLFHCPWLLVVLPVTFIVWLITWLHFSYVKEDE